MLYRCRLEKAKTNGINELQALNTKTAACQAKRKSQPSEWKSVLHVLSVSESSAADKNTAHPAAAPWRGNSSQVTNDIVTIGTVLAAGQAQRPDTQHAHGGPYIDKAGRPAPERSARQRLHAFSI